jgi:hypothetical protein
MAPLLAIVALSTTAGCASDCGRPAAQDSPLATIETFRRAFVCDERTVEYGCFSSRVKRAFGGFPAYSIGRATIRESNPLLVRFLDTVDLRARTTLVPRPDGLGAVATIDVGDGSALVLSLVVEPEYRLFHSDGAETHGFASDLAIRGNDRGFRVEVLDADYEPMSKSPPRRAELRERWVIDDFPGLDAAFAAARGERPRP